VREIEVEIGLYLWGGLAAWGSEVAVRTTAAAQRKERGGVLVFDVETVNRGMREISKL
jgi:hypothetical protein